MTQPRGIWLDTPRMGRAPSRGEPLSARFHEAARGVIARYPQPRSAVMSLLYLAQAEQGYVSNAAIAEIGELLDLTPAEIAAVATFYTMFKRAPQGRWLISVCTQPSCSLAGGGDLLRRLSEHLDVPLGGTSDDGMISLEEVECLCACDGAPVFSVNYENFERMSVEDALALVEGLRRGEEPPAGARGETPLPWDAVHRILAGLEAPR